MKKNRILIAVLATVAAIAIAGCAKQAAPTGGTSASGEKPAETALVDFTNDKGQLVCPVTGEEIADKSKAVGHEDYNGKTYYFCCTKCPPLFHADPAKYEDGKAMPAEGSMDHDNDDMGGTSKTDDDSSTTKSGA
ncbi:MAG TPA: YHS domain-containing protein [Fimbriimonadaceae bacterium]|nr:YHS domain-containing protein [Fimbriimonadaceae bacterium]